MGNRQIPRPLAMGAAAAIGLSGAFVASPGMAANDKPEASVEDALQLDVQGAALDADGNVVVFKLEEENTSEVKTFAKKHSNVKTVELAEPISAFAANDVVGGAGYLANVGNQTGACSIGFTAWSPQGDPALISAGHCTVDGQADQTALSRPSTDEANGGPGFEDNGTGLLGTFGFNQFGGPGNTAGANEDYSSIDISVIDVEDGFNLHPEVTDWTTADDDDLAASTSLVRSVGEPQLGEPVAKSGRTTGHTTDDSVDYVDGWIQVDGRWVHGFGTVGLDGAPGDSGGAIVQGETAVGVVSGGGPTADGDILLWGAELDNALEYTGGYTVALHLDTPALSSPADGGDVAPGADITGTAPAGSTLEVTPESGDAFEVEVDSDGQWVFPAPDTEGSQAYSVVATQGFDTSAALSFSVNVVAGSEPTPTPTTEPTTDPTDEPTTEPTTTTPTEEPTTPAERALAIDPEEISAADFVNEDRGVTIAARGFDEGETVTLEVVAGPENVTGIELSEYANEDGVAVFSIYGINSAQPEVYIGDYDVEVTGAEDAENGEDPLTGSFSVVSSTDGGGDDDGSGDGGGEGDLPRTGAELAGLGAGVALLVAGTATVLLTTRRNRKDSGLV